MELRGRLRRSAITWAAIAILGVLLGALPFILGWVREAGVEAAFPTTIIGGFFALFAGGKALLFRAQAEVLEKLLTESDLLAHWTYPEQDAKEELEKVLRANGRTGWKHLAWISLVTLGGSLLATVRLFARHRDADLFFYLGASGVLAVLAPAVAVLIQRARAARWRRAAPEAFVGRDAAYVFGELHTWRLQRARAKAALVTEESRPSLRVEYLRPWFARVGPERPDQFRTISIPIPPGEEERARAAALAIMRSTSPR